MQEESSMNLRDRLKKITQDCKDNLNEEEKEYVNIHIDKIKKLIDEFLRTSMFEEVN